MEFFYLWYKPLALVFFPTIAVYMISRKKRPIGLVLWCAWLFVLAASVYPMVVVALTLPDSRLGPIYQDSSIITQGWHEGGAIDISAGKGAVIQSPINGRVTRNYLDPLGNTTLVMENEHYRITMLHGEYIAQVGQVVRRGSAIGKEWNHGNTRDGAGRSCRGRDCGYHTHITVYDKRLKTNVNPTMVYAMTPIQGNKPLKISWYDPSLLGANCDKDCSTMASGAKVTPDKYGRTAACISEWMGRTVIIDGIGRFTCLDTGGKIKEHDDFIWVDLLLSSPVVPFGTLEYDWRLE